MEAFPEFYRDVHARIGDGLEAWLSQRAQRDNPLIRRGRDRLYRLNAGGKHLRGTLVYIGYRMLQDGPLADADGLAQGYELFQTAILVHDDIIDHAPRRRGLETLHSIYARDFAGDDATPGEAARDAANSMALCLGDLGLYLAQERFLEAYRDHPRLGELLCWFNGTVTRTIEGEMLDVELSYRERCALPAGEGPEKISLEALIYDIYHLKTACYTVIGPLCAGLLLGGAGAETLATAASLADDLGLAFQMQDDLLGIFGDSARLGKPVGSDIEEFKQTLLYAWMKRQGGAAFRELLRYYGRPVQTGAELEAVRGLLRASGAAEAVQRRTEALFDSAAEKLGRLEGVPEARRELLRGFMTYLRTRET